MQLITGGPAGSNNSSSKETNNNSLVSDREILHLLSGLGVHVQKDDHTEALAESRQHTAHMISLNVSIQHSPELQSIAENIRKLVNHAENEQKVYETEQFTIITKGNKTTKIRKQ